MGKRLLAIFFLVFMISTALFVGLNHFKIPDSNPTTVNTLHPTPALSAKSNELLLKDHCKEGVVINVSGDSSDNYVKYISGQGVVVINTDGDIVDVPDRMPSRQPGDLCAKYHCELAGGAYKEFSNTCVDSCEFTRTRNHILCGEAVTDSCDCGIDKCWNGIACEPN